MENSASSENHNPEPEHIQKQETRHFNRSRGRPNRPYGDLRELLNQKRQNHNDSQGNGPPPEPSYNFLSDPLRDNESDSKNKGDRRSDNYGSGRFTPRQHHTVTFENRTRGGGRGRGRGNSYKKYDQPRYHGDNRRDDEWREERHRVDQERIQRQRSDSGGWKREWDAGKEDMWQEQSSSGSNKPQYSPQNRPAYSPHPDRRNKAPTARQEGDQEQASPNQVENNQQNIDGTSSSQARAPRKFHPERGGHQYRPPPQKYNPNYNNSNRGARNFQKQVKSRRPNPINITVEFSAETGQRTCTIEKSKQAEKSKEAEKSKQVQKSRPKRNNGGKKGPGNVALVVDCEENWDDVQGDNKNDEEQNNDDIATEGTSDNHDGEDCGETEDTNEERFDYEETGDNENEEYDETDDRIEEQYDDANIEIKEQSYNNEGDTVKENDDIKKAEESKDVKTNVVDDSKIDIKQENVETRNQTENTECDNSTKKEDIVANTEEIGTKEEEKIKNKQDSTNEIRKCDTENTGAMKEECNKEKLENETNAEVTPEKIEDKEKETK